jgi:hypothetical protein
MVIPTPTLNPARFGRIWKLLHDTEAGGVIVSKVALGPGQIEVRFDSVPEALQKLFTVAQAITNDYDRFAAIVRTDQNQAVGESAP